MHSSSIIQASYPLAGRPLAGFGPKRSSLAALVVVALMIALFTGAILCALQQRLPVDAIQASVEGGL